MNVNVGSVDRLFRAILGLGFLYLAFLSGLPLFEGTVARYGAALVGIVMLVVAATRVCPVYSVLGIKSCRA